MPINTHFTNPCFTFVFTKAKHQYAYKALQAVACSVIYQGGEELLLFFLSIEVLSPSPTNAQNLRKKTYDIFLYINLFRSNSVIKGDCLKTSRFEGVRQR